LAWNLFKKTQVSLRISTNNIDRKLSLYIVTLSVFYMVILSTVDLLFVPMQRWWRLYPAKSMAWDNERGIEFTCDGISISVCWQYMGTATIFCKLLNLKFVFSLFQIINSSNLHSLINQNQLLQTFKNCNVCCQYPHMILCSLVKTLFLLATYKFL